MCVCVCVWGGGGGGGGGVMPLAEVHNMASLQLFTVGVGVCSPRKFC